MIEVEKMELAMLTVFCAIVCERIICSQYQKFYSELEYPHKDIIASATRRLKLAIVMFIVWLSTASVVGAEYIIWLTFGIMAASVVVTDFEQEVIFDSFLLFFLLTVLIVTPWLELSLLERLGGFVIGGVTLLVLAIVTRGAIGGGDIKLTAVLGFWLGISGCIDMLIAGLLFGGIGAGALLLMGRKKRKDKFAYGPYFVIAGWLIGMA